MFTLIVVSVLASVTSLALGSEVLVVHPFPVYSHTVPFRPIFEELAARGHNVTVITPFVGSLPGSVVNEVKVNLTAESMHGILESYFGPVSATEACNGVLYEMMGLTPVCVVLADILIEHVKPLLPPQSTKFDLIVVEPYFCQVSLQSILESYFGPVSTKDACNGVMYEMMGLTPVCVVLADILIEHVKPLLPPQSTKFDLIVVEPYFCQEWAVGLGAYYNAPVVATLPQPLTPFIAHSLGNPVLSSYIPNFRLSLTAEMSFLERLKNTIVDFSEIFLFYFYQVPKMDKAMRGLLGNDLPPLNDMLSGVSLVLSEAHFSLDYHRPYHMNVVQVGALTVDMPKPMPKELESFMNDAKDGVIYFSWGSHFAAQDEGQTLKALMDTFSRLKQRVILKWHTTDIPQVPQNVLVQKWVPQTEILKHKKLRLFISHCGLNSINEAAYFGVPVVGTPQFGDQHQNSRLLEYLGMGVTVTPDKVNERDALFNAIQRVLTEPSFSKNAKKRMEIMRERPMSGVEEAAYWMEYVLKFGGDSLRPASTLISWYRLANVDVYLFISLMLVLGAFVPVLLLRRLLCNRSGGNKKKKD